jgi:hypothetical protein
MHHKVLDCCPRPATFWPLLARILLRRHHDYLTSHIVLPLYMRPLSYYWNQRYDPGREVLLDEAKVSDVRMRYVQEHTSGSPSGHGHELVSYLRRDCRRLILLELTWQRTRCAARVLYMHESCMTGTA